LTGFVFDFKAKKSDVIVGYAAYFELLNGFQKTYFMTKKQVEVHAKKYSKDVF
jgi:recombination protein RecT